jgi:membrane-bound lytic murein transglycosylase B
MHLIFILVITASLFPMRAWCFGESSVGYLSERLAEKGLEKDAVHGLLGDPRLSIRPEVVIKNLFHSSPKGTKEQPDHMYIDPKYIHKGKEYIVENAQVFTDLEKRYGISPQVITAILIVESRLNTYPMRYNVFNAYTNLAALLDPDYFREIQEAYTGKYPSLKDEAVVARARKKAQWALNELYSLILLSRDLGIDPLAIQGSFAGAMGPAQFIPSSFIEYGADGDNDGKRDPFNMADAKASIASYLKRSGWKEDADEEKKRSAIWCYNRSQVYVNTIMMLCEKLSS